MITDWKVLAKQIGSLHENGERGGDDYAQIAFEQILGNDWIENTVEHIVSFKPGSEVAMNCLRLLRFKQAALYAYDIYKSSSGERAAQAVWLIKHIAHPVSFDWIEEFLNDENVTTWGLGVLDKLLWEEQIPFDSRVEALLTSVEGKEHLKEHINFIREHVRDRDTNSR